MFFSIWELMQSEKSFKPCILGKNLTNLHSNQVWNYKSNNFLALHANYFLKLFVLQPMKAPSPPTRRRTPGNSPNNSGSFLFPRSSSPVCEASNEFKRKVERAKRATRLYLLQQTGPNSFLIGGDSPDHKFRVMIGPQVNWKGRKCHLLKFPWKHHVKEIPYNN